MRCIKLKQFAKKFLNLSTKESSAVIASGRWEERALPPVGFSPELFGFPLIMSGDQ